MSDVITQIKQNIVDAIKSDQLVLPTLPEIALKVREEAEDSDSSLNSLGKLISGDQALTARIIKVANSALFKTANEVSSLQMALMRLGMDYTANLSVALAMEQMFQATSNNIDKRMRAEWQKSSEIAGICNILCSFRSNLSSDKAMLAGLTHRIGVLPILTFAEENNVLLQDSFSLDRVIKSLAPAVGKVILRKWDFPKELQTVPVEYLKFDREVAEADYTDIVTVAVLQSHMGTDTDLGKVDYSEVKAFGRLGLQAENSIEAMPIEEEDYEEAKMLLSI